MIRLTMISCSAIPYVFALIWLHFIAACASYVAYVYFFHRRRKYGVKIYTETGTTSLTWNRIGNSSPEQRFCTFVPYASRRILGLGLGEEDNRLLTFEFPWLNAWAYLK